MCVWGGVGGAKALADMRRETGALEAPEKRCAPKAGGHPPGVSTKNTWGDRSREGVSRAGSLGLARRPEKEDRATPGQGTKTSGPKG